MSGCPFLDAAVGEAEGPQGNATPAKLNDASILGFVTTEKEFLEGNKPDPTYYASYLGIEALMKLQDGPTGVKPGGKGLIHHEELTFIVVHQVFELWFKLMIADLRKARELLLKLLHIDPNSFQKYLTECLTFLRRADIIFKHSVDAFTVMETMHPADFIEFRDFLVPASGFQSMAFRVLEQLLGVPNASRAMVNNASVFTYLIEEEQAKLKEEAKTASINDIVVQLLARVRVPENFEEVYLAVNKEILEFQQFNIAKAPRNDPKAEALIKSGMQSMKSMLQDPVAWSDGVVMETEEDNEQYRRAVLGALFVTSYRHEGSFSSLASLLDALVAVEEGMLLWRGRHLHMAERMIGRRSGTGGTSSGVGYLDLTRRYRIFHVLWLVRKMFIRSSALPDLATFNLPEGSIFLDA